MLKMAADRPTQPYPRPYDVTFFIKELAYLTCSVNDIYFFVACQTDLSMTLYKNNTSQNLNDSFLAFFLTCLTFFVLTLPSIYLMSNF